MNAPADNRLLSVEGLSVAVRLDPVTIRLTADRMAGILGWINSLSAMSASLP